MQKQEESSAAKRRASVAATVSFVLLAALMIFAAFRLLGNVVQREFLTAEPTPEQIRMPAAATPGDSTVPAETAPTDGANEVAAIRTPAPESASASPSALPDGSCTPDSAATPTAQAPEPTALPLSADAASPAPAASPYPSSFRNGRMDLVVAMTDSAGHIDCIAVLALRGEAVTVIAIPSALRPNGEETLRSLRESRVLYGAQQTLPVEFHRYACFSNADVPACIDRIGPVELNGAVCDGAAVERYLAGGSDPLLRAERFADALCAIALRVRDLSLIQLLAAKSELQAAIRTNVPGGEGWALFRALRNLEPSAVARRTLPVDSTDADGVRQYLPDAALVKKLADSMYKS